MLHKQTHKPQNCCPDTCNKICVTYSFYHYSKFFQRQTIIKKSSWGTFHFLEHYFFLTFSDFYSFFHGEHDSNLLCVFSSWSENSAPSFWVLNLQPWNSELFFLWGSRWKLQSAQESISSVGFKDFSERWCVSEWQVLPVTVLVFLPWKHSLYIKNCWPFNMKEINHQVFYGKFLAKSPSLLQIQFY